MILHNLTKVRLFRILLWMSYPVATILFLPLVLRKRKGSFLFFFFDRYSMGGAQKIHIDVLNSVSDFPKKLFFTRKSPDAKFKDRFYRISNREIRDIHIWCDYLLFRLFSVHYYSFLINACEKGVVFSSNSTFFYDMLPFINSRISVIEMLHNFTYGKKGMEFFGLAGSKFIDTRIVYDSFTYRNLLEQYKQYGVPPKYTERICLIEYGVNVPPVETRKADSPPLKVLYAGRGAAQKRIWLLNRIARHFLASGQDVQFTFAGSMIKELDADIKEKSIIYEQIGEQEKMDQLFADAHVIILTSAFEGFPVVIKEGMSFGCIPVVTALPGNKMHLNHGSNALLIENFEDEEFVVVEAIRLLTLLINDPALIKSLSTAAYQYAQMHFKKDKFIAQCRQLLTTELSYST
jgi:glycosyltransferase involved in cell wall biosynthesis